MNTDAPRRDAVLFLCVQNSARSQMAEAIGRSLAPPGVAVFSAGSAPHRVRPLAIQVLEEIGLDASTQRSKHVDTIPAERVRVVVTLCADEVCPVFPGEVEHMHWPLPDPAAARGSAEEMLEAFRAVRDELHARIADLFAELPGPEA